ncbi:hypothetical protein DFJ73DRAFT_764796 [Zopfochytrium polystomum]|nr:hypothetical protein DFJ73DRAFT_764796 [Zopfochytrium polystomum]
MHAFLHPMVGHVQRLDTLISLLWVVVLPPVLDGLAVIWLGVIEDQLQRPTSESATADLERQHQIADAVDTVFGSLGGIADLVFVAAAYRTFTVAMRTSLGPSILLRARAAEQLAFGAPPPPGPPNTPPPPPLQYPLTNLRSSSPPFYPAAAAKDRTAAFSPPPPPPRGSLLPSPRSADDSDWGTDDDSRRRPLHHPPPQPLPIETLERDLRSGEVRAVRDSLGWAVAGMAGCFGAFVLAKVSVVLVQGVAAFYLWALGAVLQFSGYISESKANSGTIEALAQTIGDDSLINRNGKTNFMQLLPTSSNSREAMSARADGYLPKTRQRRAGVFVASSGK